MKDQDPSRMATIVEGVVMAHVLEWKGLFGSSDSTTDQFNPMQPLEFHLKVDSK